MIGNYKEVNSGIEDNLYPQDNPIDMHHQDTELSSAPLYTPPEETVIESSVVDPVNQCEDNESTSVKEEECDEREINPGTDVFRSMSDLIEELDMIKQKLANDETIQMVTFCQDKIIEGLSNSGAQLITNDEFYSTSKHSPRPFGIYPEGALIKRTIRPGVLIQNEVILKALVEL
jgi:hypothetical protein